ncbi:methyltransferase [Pontimonas salivibrio]|uniref:Methyltransferase n=1 Tax=Pontimonas salivibrio TaxID=1159327 RepID=A0A2L2BSM0_9MICO|nr:FkbM family methyltransferase [Pontimonas salivibrio]AVG24673.1 methyltransferase [Pontimonas salivibrio]
MRLIIDLGAHAGNDLPYYLEKAQQVVAVEANPSRCREIRSRFSAELREGRLFLEEAAITEFPIHGKVRFWVSKEHDVQSSLVESGKDPEQFDPVEVATTTLDKLLDRFGVPDYLKIDLEHYDLAILRSLKRFGSFPAALSVEVHSMKILQQLSQIGHYNSYKIIRGKSVARHYQDFPFEGVDGETHYFSFPHHSSGPIGSDIESHWFSFADVRAILRLAGTGWLDIHASTLRPTASLKALSPLHPLALRLLSTPMAKSKLAPKHQARVRKRLMRTFLN